MKFYSMMSSRLFNCGTTFSQTVTEKFFSQHFLKSELFSFNQDEHRMIRSHDRVEISSLIQTPGSVLY